MAGEEHPHRYSPRVRQHVAAGELISTHLATHLIDQGPWGYRMFRNEQHAGQCHARQEVLRCRRRP